MDFYQRLGARLRTLRLRAGLSQEALGARLGRSAGAINRYEMGRRRVPLRDLPRMAAIFGVAPASLLGGQAARPVDDARSADRVREGSPAYGRGARARVATGAGFAESLSPIRLRRLARQAKLGEPADPRALRRYARLILENFARYTRQHG